MLSFVTLPAGGQALHPRWELTISGPDGGTEAGDLRFDGTSGRLLLQHSDSAFQPLQDLRVTGNRIAFALGRGHRRFEGTVTDTLMAGTIHEGDGTQAAWRAVPLSPERGAWPVKPRLVVRQLAMGSAATSERIPVAWLSGGPDPARAEREYRELAGLAGLAPMLGAERASRADRMALGLDDGARDAARKVLAGIRHRGFGDDPEFTAIFRRGNSWRLDIHDEVPREAARYLYGFRLLPGPSTRAALASAAEALQSLGELPTGVVDSAMVRQSAWRFWSRVAADSVGTFARIDTLARRDEAQAKQLRALLAGYNDATAWWRRAVSWLLTHPWLDTPAGPRSPAQLMAAFWGVDSLAVPEIRDQRFGAVAALPSESVQNIAPYLFAPGNAAAAEWLSHGGVRDAFAAWRPLRWGETPLTIVIGGRPVTVASPESQAIVHPASFFGQRDAIRIDPGIMPLAAVAAFLHEWNHLLAAERRLSGPHPVALVQSSWQLQLREEDPWLAEGFAEWATEEVLRPAGGSAALLQFTQSEKRLGIAHTDPTDPHVLGYRLVQAMARTHRTLLLRDLLVQTLHDLGAFGRAMGLPAEGRGRAIILQRPATSVVIPEVTFTWDDGAAFDLSRRLVIPTTRPEH